MRKFLFSAALIVFISTNILAYSGGTGEPNNPYQIANKIDLLAMAADTNNYDKYFILTNDVNMQGQSFTTAIIAPDISSSNGFQGTPFTGTFDGNGHKITNFIINGGSNYFLGLFGRITTNGYVKNLGIENFTVSSSTDPGYICGVGGLAGWIHGIISNCYSVGAVGGSSGGVGGLVGLNYHGSINNCYSMSTVCGFYFVGGLVGMNDGSIGNCHSEGAVSGSSAGSDYIGGLVGENYGNVLASFWDITASNQNSGVGSGSSTGISGKTTAQMKTLSTFTSAGWDFTNETTNGTNDYWRLCSNGTTYPHLNWESIDGDFTCPDGVNNDDVRYFAERWLQGNCASSNDCNGVDMNASGNVDFKDFAVFAKNWLVGSSAPNGLADIVWLYITDSGILGHEGFNGQISKYETTNAQYCRFLNDALASGDIILDANNVLGAIGSNGGEDFIDMLYYVSDGTGINSYGAINGGAARIHYNNGSFTVDSGFENHPVTWVTWYGATAFCSYYGLRLPTEWEWQAVANYDGSFNYGCGTNINNSIANNYGSIHPAGTTVVGSFGAYGYGICDMAGNVYEWTSSLYDLQLSYRVSRGGSWGSYNEYCAVSYRGAFLPDETNPVKGFRVCR